MTTLVIDSGVGGLSVLSKLVSLPKHSFIYVADTAHFPYGEKSRPYVRERVKRIIDHFFTQLKQPLKCVILACHTASSAMADACHEMPVPTIGIIEPTVQHISRFFSGQDILLLGTHSLTQSGVYQRMLQPYARVRAQTCADLVNYIERGHLEGSEVEACIKKHLEAEKEGELVILGCTHFPLLLPLFKKVAPKREFLDPANCLIPHIRVILAPLNRVGNVEFYTTGMNSAHFQVKIQTLFPALLSAPNGLMAHCVKVLHI